jgi:hypothetical protein
VLGLKRKPCLRSVLAGALLVGCSAQNDRQGSAGAPSPEPPPSPTAVPAPFQGPRSQPPPPPSSHWLPVAGGDHARVFISDLDVTRRDRMVSFWTMWDYETVQRSPNGIEFQSDVRHYEVNCNDRTLAMTQFTEYSDRVAGGRVVDSVNVENGKYVPVVPGTIGGNIVESVCASLP